MEATLLSQVTQAADALSRRSTHVLKNLSVSS